MSQGQSLIYSTIYAGVPVYELMMNNVAVMRKASNSHINALQILKVAGLSNVKASRVLEKEFSQVQVESIGSFPGVWFTMDESIALAKKFNVYDKLLPLFSFNSQTDTAYLKPLPMLLAGLKRKFSNEKLNSSESKISEKTNENTLNQKKSKKESNDSTSSSQIQEKQTLYQRQKYIILHIFIDGDYYKLLTLLRDPITSRLNAQCINMVLDEFGHTSAHWAASLGRLHLLDGLISDGINIHKENFSGETPLIRAVTTNNNFENRTFPEILVLLNDTIFGVDNKRHTIMHHLAYLGGVKGKETPVAYYMYCIREHLEKTGKGKLELLINSKDRTGDTPLHIACRIGAIHIIEVLLYLGARRDIKNLAQKTPDDCVDPFSDAFRYLYPTSDEEYGSSEYESDSTLSPVATPRTGLRSILSLLSDDFQVEAENIVDKIHLNYKTQLNAKSEKIEEVKSEISDIKEAIIREQAETTLLHKNYQHVIELEGKEEILSHLLTKNESGAHSTGMSSGMMVPSDELIYSKEKLDRKENDILALIEEPLGTKNVKSVEKYDSLRLTGVDEPVQKVQLHVQPSRK